ncbi:MAG: M28 family peptidase [Gemmatimonadaceae bacterium]
MRQGEGTEHLAAIARGPRAAGSEGEQAARTYAASVLRDLGFEVQIERFDYSALPGRFGTPVGSALALATVLASTWLATVRGAPRVAAVVLAFGLIALALFARRMLGDGVLTLPWLRESAENLVARRGNEEPRVWLVAHLDSKSQPIPSAARVAGIVLLAMGVLLVAVASLMTLAGAGPRTLWWLGAALASSGAIPAMLSIVGNDSAGAVDNASGVAAVLTAAAMLPSELAVGVLLPSAEELGLAGARAWVRSRGPLRATALNCDSVDDDGELTIMYTGQLPTTLVNALEAAAGRAPRVRRMPLGLLTDSVAFVDGGWQSVTVSRGSLATLRRVHTRRDSLAALRGDGIPQVASMLARAAEALAR